MAQKTIPITVYSADERTGYGTLSNGDLSDPSKYNDFIKLVVKANIPPYSIIEKATWSLYAKRSSLATGSYYWGVRASDNTVTTINSGGSLTTSYKQYTYPYTNYVCSGTADAGIIDESKCAQFYFGVSGSATKYHKNRAMGYTITLPTISVQAGTGGYIDSGNATKDIDIGTEFTCTAVANAGYRFVCWRESTGKFTDDTNPTKTFTIGELAATNTVYTAIFEKNPIATFINYDGTILQSVPIEYGSTPSYTGLTPTREQDAKYTYTFSGWSPSVGAITTDVTYTAQYTATIRKYTVRWYNEDGTLLETDTTEYGVMPTYDGVIPTKMATAEFTYTFKGWHIEVTTVTGAIDYYARYTETINKYTVLWKNDDGTVLEIDSTEYGVLPTYDGATPTKASTVEYTYTFLGWDTAIEEVTRDVVYTAIYTQTVNKYDIEVLSTEGGTVTGGGSYDYGSIATLTATPNTGYKFVCWNDDSIDNINASRTITVRGNASYTATFERILITVTVDAQPPEGGTVTGGGTYDYDSTVTLSAIPNEGYVFSHWYCVNEYGNTLSIYATDYQFSNVTYDIHCTAIFEELPSKIHYGSEIARSVFDTSKNKARSVWYGTERIL